MSAPLICVNDMLKAEGFYRWKAVNQEILTR